jgi:hypothetical protein
MRRRPLDWGPFVWKTASASGGSIFGTYSERIREGERLPSLVKKRRKKMRKKKHKKLLKKTRWQRRQQGR